MKAHRLVGLLLCLMAFGAGVPNYLWLIGVLPRPTDDLMVARWFYEAIGSFFGAFIAFGPMDGY